MRLSTSVYILMAPAESPFALCIASIARSRLETGVSETLAPPTSLILPTNLTPPTLPILPILLTFQSVQPLKPSTHSNVSTRPTRPTQLTQLTQPSWFVGWLGGNKVGTGLAGLAGLIRLAGFEVSRRQGRLGPGGWRGWWRLNFFFLVLSEC